MGSFSTVSTHNCLNQVHLSHTVTILTHEMLSNLCKRYSVLNNLRMKNLHKSRPFEWKHQSACSVVVALVVCAPLEGSLEYDCQSSEPVEESKTENTSRGRCPTSVRSAVLQKHLRYQTDFRTSPLLITATRTDELISALSL